VRGEIITGLWIPVFWQYKSVNSLAAKKTTRSAESVFRNFFPLETGIRIIKGKKDKNVLRPKRPEYIRDHHVFSGASGLK